MGDTNLGQQLKTVILGFLEVLWQIDSFEHLGQGNKKSLLYLGSSWRKPSIKFAISAFYYSVWPLSRKRDRYLTGGILSA